MKKTRDWITRVLALWLFLLALTMAALAGCDYGDLELQGGGPGTEPGGEAGGSGELDWLDSLGILVDERDGKGEIRQAWQLSNRLILLKQVHREEISYYLYHTDTGKLLLIVPPKENACLEKVAGERLFFVAKEVDEAGEQAFPHLLVFDLGTYKVFREQDVFIRRDVVFGGLGSPGLTLNGIYPRGDDVVLDFTYAKGETASGTRPLTVADYSGKKLSLRIYNATAPEGTLPTTGEESLVGRISCKDLSALFPVDKIPLLRGGLPYGVGWQGEIDFEHPSIRVEIRLRERASYHVATVLRGTGLVYVVEFKPNTSDDLNGLSTDRLKDLGPAEVMGLYWRARQERSLEALGVLLADSAEVGGVTEALVQTKYEWQRGRWMVIAFAVGESAAEGDQATVKVSYKQTGYDGRLIVREDVPFGLSMQDGVWKVDISDHILALSQ